MDTGDILGVLQEEPLAAGSIFSGRHNNTQRAPRNSDVFSDDHELSLNQSFFDAHTGLTSPKALTTNTNNSVYTDSPSLPHGDALLSSGELLHKLDSSVRLSASGYPRHLVLGLTAGVDSQSELPVMLYTVHDRDSHNTRWSVYEERRKRLARPTVPAPTYPGIRSGLNSGRSVSLSSQSSLGDGNMRSSPTFAAPRAGEIGSASSHYASLNAGSNLDSSKGFNGSNGSNGFNGSNKDSNDSNGSNGSNRYPGAANSGSSNDVSSPGSLIIRSVATPSARNSAVPKQVTMQLPSDTVLQDTLSKQEYHKAMYINDSDQQLDATYTQEVELGTSSVPWSRWAVMMVMGLVAVPVLFMISFGFFDYGGHHDYSLTRSIDNEKKGDVQMRYFQRYTPLQKMLSFALGVFWILVVLAMIGVGFGLGISRE